MTLDKIAEKINGLYFKENELVEYGRKYLTTQKEELRRLRLRKNKLQVQNAKLLEALKEAEDLNEVLYRKLNLNMKLPSDRKLYEKFRDIQIKVVEAIKSVEP